MILLNAAAALIEASYQGDPVAVARNKRSVIFPIIFVLLIYILASSVPDVPTANLGCSWTQIQVTYRSPTYAVILDTTETGQVVKKPDWRHVELNAGASWSFSLLTILSSSRMLLFRPLVLLVFCFHSEGRNTRPAKDRCAVPGRSKLVRSAPQRDGREPRCAA